MCSSDADVMEKFLTNLGLDSYKKVFVENDINLETLKVMYGEGGEVGMLYGLIDIGITLSDHQYQIIELLLSQQLLHKVVVKVGLPF